MTTAQSSKHRAPLSFRRFFKALGIGRRTRTQALPPVLSGREAAARHLFGESVQWSRLDMDEYDHSPRLRASWLVEVDRRVADPDYRAAHAWGLTLDQWYSMTDHERAECRRTISTAPRFTP